MVFDHHWTYSSTQIDYCEVCNQQLNTWRAELVSLLHMFSRFLKPETYGPYFQPSTNLTRKTRDAPQLKCSPSLTVFRQYDTNSDIVSLLYKGKCNKVTHHSKGNYWTFHENEIKTNTQTPPPTHTNSFRFSYAQVGRSKCPPCFR